MKIVLTPEEHANLALVAAQRGVTPEALLELALAKRRPSPWAVKSNGWCASRAEFLEPTRPEGPPTKPVLPSTKIRTAPQPTKETN